MRKLLRNTAAATVLAALVSPVALAAEKTPANNNSNTFLFSYRGDIDPFRGDIDPFRGDIDPFRGDINPFYGDISPFWGDISPFWGDIDPFRGDINPFHGDIDPFWGDIGPFRGHIDPFYGDINPFWGDIGPFWGDIGPFWGDVSASWGDIDPFSDDAAARYQTVADQLRQMFERADSVFGAAVNHETGQSLDDAVLSALLARYGINLDDPSSLSELDAARRSAFFLDFYDGLMGFTGLDRVDHWMPAVGWSPSLSQSAGAGENVVVGVLDFAFTASEGLNVRKSNGIDGQFRFNHGAAVAGLINAPLDGEGLMGLAPNAELMTYNPFDETLSTNFVDVAAGIEWLLARHSRVFNLSLGVPGTTFSQEWANVFSNSKIHRNAQDALFVFAAGNNGYTQNFNIDWSTVGTTDNLIIVGSVDPMNRISSFSNRPGNACFTVNGVCGEGDRLMDRFLVAPGELILVSDGQGGVVRMSGTSFAAPLVSGAAALVQGRWGWLGTRDVADVLLRSARDLGAPGTDAVYGRGMLDVRAAMSPLDSDALYLVTGDNVRRDLGKSGIVRGNLNFHSPDEYSVVLFEDINDNFRDFVVSIADVTAGFTDEELAAAIDAQTYLEERNADTESGGDGTTAFRDMVEYGAPMMNRGDFQVTALAARRDPREATNSGELPFQLGVRMSDRTSGREFRFGIGEGALALSSQDGFGLFSDHRPETGGVNPVLGFASGGVYGMAGYRAGPQTRLNFGVSTQVQERVYTLPWSGEERSVLDGMDPYQASALFGEVTHAFDNGLELNLGYTLLLENAAMLGAQGTGAFSFDGGTQTSAVTVGASGDLPMAVRFDASATLAITRTNGFSSGVLELQESPVSTAFQLSMTRQGLVGDRDALRVSVIQPLHVESGALRYTSARITDRETGEMGVTSETWRLGGERPLFAEVMYGTPLFDGSTQLSMYSRFELTGDQANGDVSGITAGWRLSHEF